LWQIGDSCGVCPLSFTCNHLETITGGEGLPDWSQSRTVPHSVLRKESRVGEFARRQQRVLGLDATVWEIVPVLAAGACLHMVEEEVRTSAGDLRQWLLDRHITIALVPAPLARSAFQTAAQRRALR
jgi:non-ribosomal peptide synthetase component F